MDRSERLLGHLARSAKPPDVLVIDPRELRQASTEFSRGARGARRSRLHRQAHDVVRPRRRLQPAENVVSVQRRAVDRHQNLALAPLAPDRHFDRQRTTAPGLLEVVPEPARGRRNRSRVPGTRAAEVTREAAALDRAVAAAGDPEVSNNSDATDAALEELIFASRETFVVLESHVQLTEQAARQYEADPEPGVPDALPPARQSPAFEVAPAADVDAWADQVRDAVMEVEQAAGEAERTAAGTGSWMSRFTGCEATHLRLLRAVRRVQDLTIGSGRPDFIPGGAGSQAWQQLRERLDEPRRRASEACRSIEPPPR